MKEDELRSQIHRYLDGGIDEKDWRALVVEIEKDPKARQVFHREMKFHAQLSLKLKRTAFQNTPVPKKRFLSFAVAVAALLLMSLGLWYSQLELGRIRGTGTGPKLDLVLHKGEATYQAPDGKLQKLALGEPRLIQGRVGSRILTSTGTLLKLKYSGVGDLVLDGDSTLQIEEDHLLLKRGRLYAKIEKQWQGPKSFKTRWGAKATILGTQFELITDAQVPVSVLKVKEGRVAWSNGSRQGVKVVDGMMSVVRGEGAAEEPVAFHLPEFADWFEPVEESGERSFQSIDLDYDFEDEIPEGLRVAKVTFVNDLATIGQMMGAERHVFRIAHDRSANNRWVCRVEADKKSGIVGVMLPEFPQSKSWILEYDLMLKMSRGRAFVNPFWILDDSRKYRSLYENPNAEGYFINNKSEGHTIPLGKWLKYRIVVEVKEDDQGEEYLDLVYHRNGVKFHRGIYYLVKRELCFYVSEAAALIDNIKLRQKK